MPVSKKNVSPKKRTNKLPSEVVSPNNNKRSVPASDTRKPSNNLTNNNSTLINIKSSRKKKGKKLVCICRKEFDHSKFYVGCDLRGNWYHGDCVGISERQSKSINVYVCEECQSAKMNQELFCFCRQVRLGRLGKLKKKSNFFFLKLLL